MIRIIIKAAKINKNLLGVVLFETSNKKVNFFMVFYKQLRHQSEFP